MKLNYDSLGRDLYAKFKCTCLDPKWKDSEVAHLFHTTIRLCGYNDAYFFDEVNKEPKEIKCDCGKLFKVQWFRDGVEVIKQQ